MYHFLFIFIMSNIAYKVMKKQVENPNFIRAPVECCGRTVGIFNSTKYLKTARLDASTKYMDRTYLCTYVSTYNMFCGNHSQTLISKLNRNQLTIYHAEFQTTIAIASGWQVNKSPRLPPPKLHTEGCVLAQILHNNLCDVGCRAWNCEMPTYCIVRVYLMLFLYV